MGVVEVRDVSRATAWGKGEAGLADTVRIVCQSQPDDSTDPDHLVDSTPPPAYNFRSPATDPNEETMIHCVLHDAGDTVAVVVVEGVGAGQDLTAWIMDEDRTISLKSRQDIPIGHKVALKDMNTGDTVLKYGVDIGKVIAPIRQGEHAHVHNIKTKRW